MNKHADQDGLPAEQVAFQKRVDALMARHDMTEPVFIEPGVVAQASCRRCGALFSQIIDLDLCCASSTENVVAMTGKMVRRLA